MLITDKNLFAYCDNNPITREDSDGEFWETALDVISLSFSVADVVKNPSDPWAWAGLVGDAIDLVPFVTGVGEITCGVKLTKKAVEAVDDVHDAAKAVDNVTEGIETTQKAVKVSSSVRSGAVRKAWKNELIDVQNGGKGISRTWSDAEKIELMSRGKVAGYQGHHMKSVKGYPNLAGDPTNIQFLTRSEHLSAHRGNFRNITHERYRF